MDKELEQKQNVKAAREYGKKILNKRMVQVLLNDPMPLLHHGEILLRDGERLGDIRSASYGHTLGGAVGLSMIETPKDSILDRDFFQSGDWNIEIGNNLHSCKVSLRPMYDPKNIRIKS
mmetsp:Transcript_11104/g.15634  ORF Transcript_11104/g.15634 Transcript_11104/m.15634 type:complete len:119 (-) Transcript_11104:175-531(-)